MIKIWLCKFVEVCDFKLFSVTTEYNYCMFIFVLNALSLCQTLICLSFTKQTLAKFSYNHASFKYGTMCFNKDS